MLQNFKDARASGLFFKILNKPHPYFNCLVKYYYTRKYLCNVSLGSYYTIPFTIKLFAFLFLHAKGNSLRAIRLHRLTRIENILHVLETFSAVHVVISPRDILSLLRFVLAIYLCFFSLSPIAQLPSCKTWNRRSLVLFPLCQHSFRGLMIVIATGFIPLPPLSIVSTIVMWGSSQWFGRNIVLSTGLKNSRKAWVGALAAAI